MSAEFSVEKMCCQIASMSKSEVIRRLINFKGSFRMDYSKSYLETLSTDRLRHILLAAVVTFNGKRAS